jgi:glycosyltransferase involved in cell wall biosynthesis
MAPLERMRVLIADPPAYTPPYDDALCAALARAGADVELVTSAFGYGVAPEAVGYERIESFYRFAPGGPGSPLRRAARLAQHIPGMLDLRRRAADADVVHFQWLPVPGVDSRLLPRDRPLVLTVHDPEPRVARGRPGRRRLAHAMDALVVHSEAGRERVAASLGVPVERVHVIPHGVLGEVGGARAEADPPEVLLFGLLRPYKGLDVLLEAWRGLDPGEPAARLRIVGAPRYDIAALRAAAPPGVEWDARWISEAEVAPQFRRAAIAVLPYLDADQSGVLFTALALGTPLVLSDVGGFPEIAATGAAEIVPAGDAGALRDTLARLLADPGRRAEMSAAAFRAARERYGWDAIAERTLALYRSLGAG